MEIADLKQQLKSGEFDKFYIFHGQEHQIMKIYIDLIAEKGGYEIAYVDSLVDLMTGAKTKSLIPVHHLYIIMDDKEFLTNEKMWEKFTGLKDDVVIFYYTTTDKRLKFWKNYKDRAVEFTRLEDRILIKYIQKDIELCDECCQTLIEATDGDYGRILLEINKMKSYCEALHMNCDVAANATFRQFVEEGIIYCEPKDAIFDFVAAVLERDAIKTYDLLAQSYAVGEANLTLLSVLYNNIKTLLQVQSAKDYKALGLNGFAVKNVIRYRNNYSNGELIRAMKIIREAESGIKKGLIPEELATNYVLVQMM